MLVVDDDASLRRVIRRVLQRGGCTVEEAGDGESGLARFLAYRPHLAFIDLGLPGIDGARLIRAIRAEHPDVRLIAMSGAPHFEGVEPAAAARTAGADAFLAKPLWPHTILDALRAERAPDRAGATGAEPEP
ncbi:MAG: response regulator [Deltaproteobacteria bacterium]|nr:response regulator [Deltaproteobacteria bacterium]